MYFEKIKGKTSYLLMAALSCGFVDEGFCDMIRLVENGMNF